MCLNAGKAQPLPQGPPLYAIIGDYIEIKCQIGLTKTALWEYTWETPQNQTLSGCPVHYVSSVQPVNEGRYYCVVLDPLLREYDITLATLDMFSVRTFTELIVLSGMVVLCLFPVKQRW